MFAEQHQARMRNCFQLTAGDVHVWQVPLSGETQPVHALRGLLAVDEIKRADAFHFERHRRSYILAHGAMRRILAGYVQLAPQSLVFVQGEKGKPELTSESGGRRIRFNLSHSGDFALLGVAQDSRLGVDIERINAQFAGEDFAERFFSRNEAIVFRAIAADSRVDAFFSCWTRKEAYIKALGGGLSIPLDSFDVAFAPGLPAALLHTAVAPDARLWKLYDISAPHGYKAALVVEGDKHRLQQKQWGLDSRSRLHRHPHVNIFA